MPHLANPKLLTGTARDKKVVLILGDGVHIILAGRRQLAGCFGHTAGDDERSSVAAQQECSVALSQCQKGRWQPNGTSPLGGPVCAHDARDGSRASSPMLRS